MIPRNMSDLLDLAKQAVQTTAELATAAQSSGEEQRHHYELDGRELKLELDTRMSALLTSNLAESGIGVISEENLTTHHNSDEYVWLIDPLDGSFNFLRGSGPSAISCALLCGTQPIFGVIQNLVSKSLSWGGPDFGAYTDNSPISVSNVSKMQDAVVCTGIPAHLNTDSTAALAPLLFVIRNARKIRMIGSAAVSLVLVASGAADLYTEESVMPWDVAAGMAIVAGASGRAYTNEFSRKKPISVVAGSSDLVDAFLQKQSL